MQTIVYLVRHGEFENPKNILPGRMKGYPLSKSGINQINKSASFLKNKGISYLYSSPILRTKQSAQIIKKVHGLKLINFSKEIIEIKSSLDGSARKELAKTNFDFYSKKLLKPGDEDISMIEKRMKMFLVKILKKHKEEKIIAVTHADPIMIIRASILKMPLNLHSIREPEKDYPKFGDVFKVSLGLNNEWSVKRVFSPH